MRVVLDTSVLIMALRSKKEPPSASVVALAVLIGHAEYRVVEAKASSRVRPRGEERQALEVVLDGAGLIEAEYREVAARPEHASAARHAAAAEVIDAIVELAITVDSSLGAYSSPMVDEGDRMIVETARAADAVLLTWNVRHVPADAGVRVLTPPAFLAHLREQGIEV